MAKLVVTAGEIDQREFRFDGDIVIGRSSDCDVRIPRPSISRHHAKIRLTHGRYYITDLKAPHGIILNGTRVRKSELRDGDRIQLGDCELAFQLSEDSVLPQSEVHADTGATIISSLDTRKPVSGESDLADTAKVRQLKTYLKILQEVAETACGTLEIDGLLKRILEQLLRVFPHATHAQAVLLDMPEAGNTLHLATSREGQSSTNVKISATLLNLAIHDRKAVLAADAAEDDRFRGAASIVGQSLCSIMCSPLIVGDKALGAIQVDTTSSATPFRMDDLRLLATVAGQMAVAAESARLHHELMAKERLAAVGETISSLVHCIKNVLNALQGGAYILDLGIKKQDSEKTGKGWEMVKRNTDFMLDLTKDMLAYCKKEVIHREPADLAELLNNTMLMIQQSASQKGIDASLTFNTELPEVEIDPTGMKRVVLNLLTNAVEACSEGEQVKLIAGVVEAEQKILMTIQDTGPGIPEEIRERLFEPFFTTKGSHGTGLGLALVKKVISDHGGNVEVESEVGKGTAFHISLPL